MTRLPHNLSKMSFLVAVLLPLVSPCAFADGCFVWKNREIDILEPEQKCLIFFDQQTEDLVLSVKYEGAPDDFGWIVPVPAEPDLYAEEAELFEHLSKATQRRQYKRGRGMGMANASLSGSSIKVHKIETVGIYEATVLSATDPTALQDWLVEREYQLPPDADEVLRHYTENEWFFVALRLDPNALATVNEQGLREGTIQPIRLRFATPRPVFPLYISSLNPGPSDILIYVLSRSVLEPETPAPEGWETQVHSRPGHHHWIYQYEHHSDSEEFLPDYMDDFCLSKHRAAFSPEEMRDLYFRPYDPEAGLRSDNEDNRIDALIHLGYQQPADSEDLLCKAQKRVKSDRELHALLWALGQVGGAKAEKLLIKFLDEEELGVRVGAIDALAEMGSTKAAEKIIPDFLHVDSGDKAPSRSSNTIPRMAAYDYVIRNPSERARTLLAELSRKHEGAAVWAKLAVPPPIGVRRWRSVPAAKNDPALLMQAALARCGDEKARRDIVEALIKSSVVTQPQSSRSPIKSRVITNGIPGTFWVGSAVRHAKLTSREWPALSHVYDLYRLDLVFRDNLLREAASDPRVPELGRIILLSQCETLSDDDLHALGEIWARAIERPWQTSDTFDTARGRGFYAPENHDREHPVLSFNARACCIVFALSRHERTDKLLQLLETTPDGDQLLRGAILAALARERAEGIDAEILEYVRTNWFPIAASKDILDGFEGVTDEKILRRRLRALPLDFDEVEQRLTSYLEGRLRSCPMDEALAIWREMPLVLRVRFISYLGRIRGEPSEHIATVERLYVDLLEELGAQDTGLGALTVKHRENFREFCQRQLEEAS